MTDQAIVVFNSGSSSLKFALYRLGNGGVRSCICRGQVAAISTRSHFYIRDATGAVILEEVDTVPDHATALKRLLQWIDDQQSGVNLRAAAHRVVHGGMDFLVPVLVDDRVLQQLKRLVSFAPLHQPHNLHAIDELRLLRPDLPQIACFDTSFHRAMPMEAQRYALPQSFFDQGVRAYGFHGLSYEYILSVLPDYLAKHARGRVIVAHLGSGASMCALLDGKSVATTMGFSPLDGLIMGTRCGAIDPGVLLYLLRQGMSIDALDELLYQHSGLLGLSGISGDMQTLLASENEQATLAVEQFCYRAAREVGSLVAALSGLDAIIFTGGIGEHSPAIRERICEKLQWLGVQLSDDVNCGNGTCISTAGSSVSVWVIATDEEDIIAGHGQKLLVA